MKKWEYRLENISAKDFTDKDSLNDIKNLLSRVGSKGWDLVNIIPVGIEKEGLVNDWFNAKNIIFTFKREVK